MLIKTFAFAELSCLCYNGVFVPRQSSVRTQIKKRVGVGEHLSAAEGSNKNIRTNSDCITLEIPVMVALGHQ